MDAASRLLVKALRHKEGDEGLPTPVTNDVMCGKPIELSGSDLVAALAMMVSGLTPYGSGSAEPCQSLATAIASRAPYQTFLRMRFDIA